MSNEISTPQIDAQFDSTNYTNGITLGDYNSNGCGKLTSLIDTEFENEIYFEDKNLEKIISDINWAADISDDTTDYFYIEALEDGVEIVFDTFLYSAPAFNLTPPITDFPNYVKPVLYWSINKSNWYEYILGTSIGLNADMRIYFKGNNRTSPWYDSNYGSGGNIIATAWYKNKFNIQGRCKAGGNVMSLRYSNPTGDEIIPCDYAFAYLFENCTGLVNSPELSATELNAHCYFHMFDGCTSLTTPPELPATTLADHCYYDMFKDCTGLIIAPELPAIILIDYCYAYMFNGCTSLITPPRLPATTLALNCYEYMFSGCTSLTSIPRLPATTLPDYCYEYMFQNSSIVANSTNSSPWIYEYRIPYGTASGQASSKSLSFMFSNVDTTLSPTPTPSINTTFYVSVPVQSS